MVKEPSVEDTIAILRGLKEKYEVHHKVKIKDAALVAAAVLSHRYITDRFLPDKAIDLIDEAASRLRIEIDSMPHEIDEIERRIMQLQIERVSVARESDAVSQERLSKLDAELADLKEKSAHLKTQWQAEKAAILAIGKIKEELEAARAAMADAERRGDLQKAAELRYGTLMELDKRLEAENARLAEVQKHGRMLKEEVDEEDIAETVAKWTGIPVTRLLEAEVQKLVKMEERLSQRVVGQSEAIIAVSNAVRRARSGLSDPNRPIGSFLFLGPTGRRQDRARPRARRVSLRRRARHDPHRHVRVHGKAHRGPSDRRAPRLRRLRRGRPAHRGRPAPAVLRHPLRRDREGPRRRLQRPAAAPRRRPTHRRPGPHRRFPEYRGHHDLEPRAATSSARTKSPSASVSSCSRACARRCGRSS